MSEKFKKVSLEHIKRLRLNLISILDKTESRERKQELVELIDDMEETIKERESE